MSGCSKKLFPAWECELAPKSIFCLSPLQNLYIWGMNCDSLCWLWYNSQLRAGPPAYFKVQWENKHCCLPAQPPSHPGKEWWDHLFDETTFWGYDSVLVSRGQLATHDPSTAMASALRPESRWCSVRAFPASVLCSNLLHILGREVEVGGLSDDYDKWIKPVGETLLWSRPTVSSSSSPFSTPQLLAWELQDMKQISVILSLLGLLCVDTYTTVWMSSLFAASCGLIFWVQLVCGVGLDTEEQAVMYWIPGLLLVLFSSSHNRNPWQRFPKLHCPARGQGRMLRPWPGS